jgi:UDP-N-acetylmuramoylalanine--D-glutamate ligase
MSSCNQSKCVLVLGLGETGLALAHWCARGGAAVVVADTRADPPGRAQLMAEWPEMAFSAGQMPLSLLEGVDLVAISPGLAPHGEPQAKLINAAHERGIPVWSEIEFFAQELATLRNERGYAPHVLAITGTNGKTTVTSLTGLLCERAGRHTAVAGNISPAALAALEQALLADELPEVWVLELSSFQLQHTYTLNASAAAVLNISQDHLDWHQSMDAYSAAKARVFGPDTIRILCRDDPRSMAMASPESSQRDITFGLDAPTGAHSYGIVDEGGMRWLEMNEPAQSEPRKARQRKLVEEEPIRRRLMPVDALHIRGNHNAANALAALALCRAIDLPLAPMLHGLREYTGEPHRVELICRVHDVDYIDDSKGTNVGATVAALEGLGQRVVLIAGGEGKGQDFNVLCEPVARHARAVMLIGKDASRIRAALLPAATRGVALVDCASLEQAVVAASEHAQSGDAVLLSPACASFDMFRDYKHRAQVFLDAARELAMQAGQPC